MPDLEYTIEVSSAEDFELPDGEEMSRIVKQALREWNSAHRLAYLDVEVTHVSDDL